MNHYCLCCAHCPKSDEFRIEYDIGYTAVCDMLHTINSMDMIRAIDEYEEYYECCDYTPRPEPQYSQCVAVLKMLGVEVSE